MSALLNPLSPDHAIDEDALPALFATAGERGISSAQYAGILGNIPRAELSRIAVHVRIPFCPSRCLSCDHHTTVTHNTDVIDRYLGDLEREIDMVTDCIGRNIPLSQLHLGGGTPNYLSDTQLVRLMAIIDQHFKIDRHTEASLEASPKRCSPSQLALLSGLGFSTLYLQIRDLDDEVQLAIGRAHSLPMLSDVVDGARQEGFSTIGMDVVYGLPYQSVGSIRRTLDQMLALQPERISCQAFSRRPEVFRHQRAIEASSLPSLGDKVAMFSTACDAMLDAGYEWVGLDCFASPKDPLTSARAEGRLYRNWIGYTASGDYNLFGFGADAVSQLSEADVQNVVSLEEWHQALAAGELPVQCGVSISEHERRRRKALNRLMCNLELSDYHDLLDAEANDGQHTLSSLERGGLVRVMPEKVEITDYGRFALHQMFSDASPHFRCATID